MLKQKALGGKVASAHGFPERGQVKQRQGRGLERRAQSSPRGAAELGDCHSSSAARWEWGSPGGCHSMTNVQQALGVKHTYLVHIELGTGSPDLDLPSTS